MPLQTGRSYLLSKLGSSFDHRFLPILGTIRFEVIGAGVWLLRIDHGNLNLQEKDEPADCNFRISESDLEPILEGKHTFLTSFLRGRIQIEGDRALAAGAHNFFQEAA